MAQQIKASSAHHLTAAAFTSWRHTAADDIAARLKMQQVIGRLTNLRAAQVLTDWRMFTDDKRAWRAQQQKAEARLQRLRCSAVLFAWHRLAKQRQAVQGRLAKAVRSASSACMSQLVQRCLKAAKIPSSHSVTLAYQTLYSGWPGDGADSERAWLVAPKCCSVEPEQPAGMHFCAHSIGFEHNFIFRDTVLMIVWHGDLIQVAAGTSICLCGLRCYNNSHSTAWLGILQKHASETFAIHMLRLTLCSKCHGVSLPEPATSCCASCLVIGRYLRGPEPQPLRHNRNTKLSCRSKGNCLCRAACVFHANI